jgi:hypothetical protein
VGPTAIARDYCDEEGPRPRAGAAEAPAGPRWRVAVAYGWLSSQLRFGDVGAPFYQRSVAASATWRLDDRWTLQAGAGAVIGGGLDAGGVSYSMDPGWLARVGASWLAVEGRGWWPFVALSASFAASGVQTTGPGGVKAPLTSIDAGLSVSVGKAFFGAVAPYVGAKVFGGPVFWTLDGASTTGTDVDHWQVAFGVLASLPLGIDLTAEWAPFGARSALAQVGWAF